MIFFITDRSANSYSMGKPSTQNDVITAVFDKSGRLVMGIKDVHNEDGKPLMQVGILRVEDGTYRLLNNGIPTRNDLGKEIVFSEKDAYSKFGGMISQRTTVEYRIGTIGDNKDLVKWNKEKTTKEEYDDLANAMGKRVGIDFKKKWAEKQQSDEEFFKSLGMNRSPEKNEAQKQQMFDTIIKDALSLSNSELEEMRKNLIRSGTKTDATNKYIESLAPLAEDDVRGQASTPKEIKKFKEASKGLNTKEVKSFKYIVSNSDVDNNANLARINNKENFIS